MTEMRFALTDDDPGMREPELFAELLDFLADWFRDARNGTGLSPVGNFAVVEAPARNGLAKVRLQAG